MENELNELDKCGNFRNMMSRNNSFYNEFRLMLKNLETFTSYAIFNSTNFLNAEDISKSLRDKIQKLTLFN